MGLQRPPGGPCREFRGQRQNKEQPSSLPLLHTLHLQTEGGEAGQEVRHFIHLQGDSQAGPGASHWARDMGIASLQGIQLLPPCGVSVSRMGVGDFCVVLSRVRDQ